MIRKITLLFLACIAIYIPSFAQSCGFDLKHQQLMTSNPSYAAQVNQFNNKWATLQQNALMVTLPNGKWAWEIPVVVHVMYTTEKTAYNVSDAQIQAMIDYLNDAWQATWPSYPDTTTIGTRMHMVFKLAKRDPNCQPTNGIIHYNVTQTALPDYYSGGIELSTTTGEDEQVIKALSIWPNDEYYNIWIVNKIDGIDGLSPGPPFTAGYAYFPGAPANIDGTVMLASQSMAGEITLPHEMGHAFNLYHVFQGSCPPAGPCASSGDMVCDTEPQQQSPFTCPTGINPCTGVAFNNGPKNFMDYSNCQQRFTQGQRTRVDATVNNVNQRGALISSLGATPLPTTPLPTMCTPTMPTPPSFPNTGFGPRTITIQNGIGYVMSTTSGGYADDGNQFYIDRTCKVGATLQAGAPHFMSVACFGSSRVRVYIDYNNNGSYAEPNELIYSANGVVSPGFTFTPPATGAVYCIPLRMRVVVDNNTAGALGPCTPLNVGQAEDYTVTIYGTGGSSSTGVIDIPNPPVGGNPSCLGSTITLAAPHPASMVPVWYGWYRRTTVSGSYTLTYTSTTDSLWTSNIFTNLDTVFVRVAYQGICGVDTSISDSIVLFRPLTIAPAVTIGIASGTNPTCVDDTVTLSVISNSNPGGAPTYQWRRNGNPIIGANATSYKVIGGTSGDVYSVVMTSSAGAPCAIPSTANSNNITITQTQKTPTVTIALTTGTNPGCAGQLVTFSVMTKTTAGTAPTYAWFVNGIQQVGATGTTFTTAALNNNDIVTAQMTSNSPCALVSTVTSNAITYTTTTIVADVTIMQIFGGTPHCSGHRAEFTALVVNGGPTPQFQWLINNAVVIGANSTNFSTSVLANGDVVKCILVSSDPCVVNTLDTSAGITMTVTQSLVPTVSFSITKGNNPGCLDSLIEFTATATNIGTSPNFDWFVNDIGPFFNGDVLSINTLLNGDKVTVRVNQTDGGCYLPDTLFSAPMYMTLSPTPEPPIISLIGNMLVANKSGAFVWFGPAGQLTGSSSNQYHPTELGAYWCVTDNNGCWSKPSNILTITLLDINDINIENVDIFPNPTSGEVTFDWKHTVNMKIDVFSTVGQKLLHDEMKNQARKTIDLSGLANGIYFVVMTDEQGKSGTARVTVTK